MSYEQNYHWRENTKKKKTESQGNSKADDPLRENSGKLR